MFVDLAIFCSFFRDGASAKAVMCLFGFGDRL